MFPARAVQLELAGHGILDTRLMGPVAQVVLPVWGQVPWAGSGQAPALPGLPEAEQKRLLLERWNSHSSMCPHCSKVRQRPESSEERREVEFKERNDR